MSMLVIVGMVTTCLILQDRASPATPAQGDAQERAARAVDGAWQAWLESPGGDIPFTLELSGDQRGQRAVLRHPEEQITAATKVVTNGPHLTIEWTDLNSRLVLEIGDGGLALDGVFERRIDGKHQTRMPCHARFGATTRPGLPLTAFLPPAPGGAGLPALAEPGTPCAARYRVSFQDDPRPGVAVLQEDGAGNLSGTVLTVLGDCRLLVGKRVGNLIELWRFDGADAFMVRARRGRDGSLQGQTWSGGGHARTWTATPDASAAVPDPYEQTKLRSAKLGNLAFEDLSGQRRKLDRGLLGGATLVLLLEPAGANSQAAARLLDTLLDEYAGAGLSGLGLAVSTHDDKAHALAEAQAFAARLRLQWPILLAGNADREQVGKTLPFLDRPVAYPTLLFVDKTASIRAVYTGFTGPAATEEHALMLDDWRARIAELLR